MDVVKKIESTPCQNDRPTTPVEVKSIRIESNGREQAD
jgi:hypothetical protein